MRVRLPDDAGDLDAPGTREFIAEVAEGISDPRISPARVLAGHSSHEVPQLIWRVRPPELVGGGLRGKPPAS